MPTRRRVVQWGLATMLAGGRLSWAAPNSPTRRDGRIFFTSQGKTGVIGADGSGLNYLEFDVPNQATWQPTGFLPDGGVVFMSMEPRRDGPGKPFDEFYHQTPTHLWIQDPKSGELKEICDKDRLAPFYAPCLALSDDRMLVQVVRRGGGQVYNMKLDGTDAREFTKSNEGLPYGLSLSPDGKRVAYHLASPQGYQVWTSDTDGGERKMLAGHPEHLYFGTAWSPDGQWVTYVDCDYRNDPGHDWADVCVGRADGSEHRVLTSGGAMWFGATYGNATNRGGGSNVPGWTKDGKVLFPRRLPGSKVAWEYQPNRPDTDHFNRDYKPELAKGGTEICTIDPSNGSITPLTKSDPVLWDFRSSQSPDGRSIAFCRSATGESPALWVMDADGSNQRELTKGIDGLGADHPRWMPAPS